MAAKFSFRHPPLVAWTAAFALTGSLTVAALTAGTTAQRDLTELAGPQTAHSVAAPARADVVALTAYLPAINAAAASLNPTVAGHATELSDQARTLAETETDPDVAAQLERVADAADHLTDVAAVTTVDDPDELTTRELTRRRGRLAQATTQLSEQLALLTADHLEPRPGAGED